MNIKFKWIGAGCFVLEIDDSFRIACDPCLSPAGTLYDFGFFKSKRIYDPVFQENDFDDINLWLITHDHKDHVDEPGLKVINSESTVICHSSARSHFNNHFKHLRILKWKEEYESCKNNIIVNVKAVTAKHGANFVSSYFAGGVNGYWLEVRNGEEEKVIYVTGDTVWNKQISNSFRNKICDVLVPNMGAVRKDHFGGPLTLNESMLLAMVHDLEPVKILPIHYGCFTHYSDETKLNKINDSRIKLPERGKKFEFNI